jgi:SAM-dependent methyltransferase
MINLILVLVFIVFLTFAYAGISFAPWVPTWKKDLPRIFKLAGLKPGEIFYDLGCGNGKVVLYAHKNFQAKAIGLEISLPLYLACKLRQLFNLNKNLVFKFKDLYSEDLRQANVVYFFGVPDKLDKLKVKLERELKPGCRVISYVFPVIGWEPAEISKPEPVDIAIYSYIMG